MAPPIETDSQAQIAARAVDSMLGVNSVATPSQGPREVRQLRGIEAVTTALDEGRSLGLVLVLQDDPDPALIELRRRAKTLGVPVRAASAAVLRRMNSGNDPTSVLGLSGRDPRASFSAVLERGGCVWLLLGVVYPTNAGVAIRTAEGSGADAVVIDADWDHAARRTAVRASMRADWYLPVFWQSSEATFSAARAAGYRVFGIENTGRCAPWDVDLTGPCVFVIGGEAHGIPPAALDGCDAVVRVPMAGFIPSYNLQIAVGVVATERLRQQAGLARRRDSRA